MYFTAITCESQAREINGVIEQVQASAAEIHAHLTNVCLAM